MTRRLVSNTYFAGAVIESPHSRISHCVVTKILREGYPTGLLYLRAQNEVTDALTDVAFAMENLSSADRARAGMPTKGDIVRYLSSDLTNLAFVWIALPPKDKDAIRRAADLYIKPVFRRGAEMLKPIISHPYVLRFTQSLYWRPIFRTDPLFR